MVTMISPSEYEHMYLVDQSPEAVFGQIRMLRRQMTKLRATLEPAAGVTAPAGPEIEEVQFDVNRLYLERAKAYYAAMGGVLQPTPAERRGQALDSRMAAIETVEFSIGGYFGGHDITTVDLTTGRIRRDHLPESQLGRIQFPPRTTTVTDFITQLTALHLGEWRRRYVEPDIMDGTQWELIITFSDTHYRFEAWGSNNYPYNFANLEALMTAYDRLTLAD
ncbi:hypothetical protein [Lacticaseibacillus absianus]|uniref:hypothetical protein n=1 Tax=Lacticaseibacillus absianus TaxID=2729623 RepID=UPI001FEADB67|nr:hypothetical protein [Lacticaseibacillus absianus]